MQGTSTSRDALGNPTQYRDNGLYPVIERQNNQQQRIDTRYTVWLDHRPLAVVDIKAGSTTAAITQIHSDHLGTPRAATNSSGKIIWHWHSDPFGKTAPNEDPDGDGVAFTLNLRFPGQYYDQETGWHYNLNRTYNPATGRYLEADPIGLNGGWNLYGYANQNPVNFVDPKGLDDFFAGIEIDLVGITGVEIAFGFVYDSDRELDSGLFFSIGHGVGANVGAGITFGYAECDIEGTSFSADGNYKILSFYGGQGTDGGRFGGLTVGVGIGGSMSVNQTYTYSVQDYIDWVLD